MSQVKLILVESVHSLGEAGDLVTVKPGYARNYLLPQRKAVLATESRVKELEHHKRVAAEKAAREFQNLRLVKQKLESLSLEVSARAGPGGKLFGSVTAAQVAELLAARGVEIERRRIALSAPIKEVGTHKVQVQLHRDIVAEVTLSVAPQGGAAPPEEEPEELGDRRSRRDADEYGDEDEEQPAADEA